MTDGPRLTYTIPTGAIALGSSVIAHGYSGADRWKNDAGAVKLSGRGPIPPGDYRLTSVRDSQTTGPFSIVLDPMPGTDTFGRSLFRIHGDSIKAPGTASHGCIILPRAIRERIWNAGARVLTVVGNP